MIIFKDSSRKKNRGNLSRIPRWTRFFFTDTCERCSDHMKQVNDWFRLHNRASPLPKPLQLLCPVFIHEYGNEFRSLQLCSNILFTSHGICVRKKEFLLAWIATAFFSTRGSTTFQLLFEFSNIPAAMVPPFCGAFMLHHRDLSSVNRSLGERRGRQLPSLNHLIKRRKGLS